jgi:ribonuclease P protein subunit POP4
MDQQFGAGDLKTLIAKFEPTHPQYDQTSAILHKSDFHGAKLKVSSSKNCSLVGKKGIVLLDTKGAFSIISKDNVMRVIPKSDSMFELKWKNARFTVYGKHLCYRSAERATKKIKTIDQFHL